MYVNRQVDKARAQPKVSIRWKWGASPHPHPSYPIMCLVLFFIAEQGRAGQKKEKEKEVEKYICIYIYVIFVKSTLPLTYHGTCHHVCHLRQCRGPCLPYLCSISQVKKQKTKNKRPFEAPMLNDSTRLQFLLVLYPANIATGANHHHQRTHNSDFVKKRQAICTTCSLRQNFLKPRVTSPKGRNRTGLPARTPLFSGRKRSGQSSTYNPGFSPPVLFLLPPSFPYPVPKNHFLSS